MYSGNLVFAQLMDHLPLRGEVSGPLSDALVLTPRPVSVHSLRAIGISRKSAGHRNLPEDAHGHVPLGHPWRHRP